MAWRGLTVERAKLAWLGVWCACARVFGPTSGRRNAREGRRKLENARGILVRLKLELELTAIAVDLAASLLPDKVNAKLVIKKTLSAGVVSGEPAMGLESVVRASRRSIAELAAALQALRQDRRARGSAAVLGFCVGAAG